MEDGEAVGEVLSSVEVDRSVEEEGERSLLEDADSVEELESMKEVEEEGSGVSVEEADDEVEVGLTAGGLTPIEKTSESQ